MRKRHLKILAFVMLAGTAAYTLGGFLLAPRIVKYWIEHSIATEPGTQLGVRSVYVNPFTLFVSLTKVTLIEEENKPIISAERIETRFPMLESVRGPHPGYDLDVRDLRVTDPSTGRPIGTIPNLTVTELFVNAAQGTVRLGAARLENPALYVLRDASGTLRLPGWLRPPSDGSSPTAFVFDTLEVSGGTLHFADNAVSPPVKLDAADIVGKITREHSTATEAMAIHFEGRSGEIIAAWRDPERGAPTDVDLTLRRVELPAVSAYFAQITGHRLSAGTADFVLNYRHRGAAAGMQNRIVVDGLRVEDRAPTDAGMELPLEFAVALLQDDAERIEISIEAPQSAVDDDLAIDPIDLFVNRLTAYIDDLVAAPFDVLANLAGGGDDNLGELVFQPGSAAITAASAEKITSLGRALSQRPLLALRARPTYAAAADRDAIAAQQVRLHIDLATSAGSFGASAPAAVDFEDPKVRSILDEFAGARLPESRRNAISRRFENKDAAYYRALHEALVANENVSDTALRRLARFRARAVVDTLAASGVDVKRLLLAETIAMMTEDTGIIVVQLDVLRLNQIATE